jgi:hypothetical protein
MPANRFGRRESSRQAEVSAGVARSAMSALIVVEDLLPR